MKPVCVPCQRFFRMKKTGFYFIEGMPKPGEGAEPGTSQPERWQPYKLWAGDLWECEGCHAQIVSGFGRNAIREHHEPDFASLATALGAEFQVNDC